jgi:hypothetical protein
LRNFSIVGRKFMVKRKSAQAKRLCLTPGRNSYFDFLA